MESKVADRIIELAWKWQNRVTWDIGFEAAAEWRKYRDKANQDRATAKRMADLGQQGEMLEMFRHDAERDDEIAETGHKQAVAAQQELLDLANLLRQHAPRILRLVPVVSFHEAPPADLLPWLSAMREIEGEILTLVAEPTPAAAGAATNGSVEDQALAVLVLHQDWTNEQIATAVGTHPKYLSSKHCSKFKAARAAIRSTTIPSGSKTKLGSLEAVGDDDLDFDAMDERMKSNR